MQDYKLYEGRRVAMLSTIVTVFLALAKLVAGVLSNSIVLIADSVHSFSDVLAIFASWFGLKIAAKKPDERFKYGYYKAENLATLIVIGFLFYAAYEVFISSYHHLFQLPDIKIPLVALAVSLFSSLISYFIAYYEIKVGRKINSQSLIANGQESKTDVWSSLLVFVGILMSYFKVLYVEAVIGILLSFLIMKIAVENLKITVYALMDASPDKELEDNLRRMIKKHRIKALNSLKLRQSGPFIFGDAEISLSKAVDVSRANSIVNSIREEIMKRFPKIESFTITVKPFTPERLRLLIPVDENKGIKSRISSHFGRAGYYLIAELKKNQLKNLKVIKNENITKKIHAGFNAAKDVLRYKIDAIALNEIGEISFHTLRDNQIEIYKADGKTAEDVINALKANKLTMLRKPTHETGVK